VYLYVAGSYLRFELDDPWGYTGSYLLEKLAASGYLAIWGWGEGSVSESTVSGSFRDASFEYCARSDADLECLVELVQCSPSALTLVRR
jgi:hypothetical protein